MLVRVYCTKVLYNNRVDWLCVNKILNKQLENGSAVNFCD